jgi:hypothetical protein
MIRPRKPLPYVLVAPLEAILSTCSVVGAFIPDEETRKGKKMLVVKLTQAFRKSALEPARVASAASSGSSSERPPAIA